VLVHICCSVDSHYFLTRLKADYPNKKIVGYFYNPNIHPKEEYDLRLLDVQKSCKKLNIELIEGEYNDNEWFNIVKGLELEPEKGTRCEVCFDMRFIKSAQIAQTLNIDSFTSTLLQSPLKSQESIYKSAQIVVKTFGVEFIFVDYRSKGGMNEQNSISKQEGLYRQNYCGCLHGLILQREKQNKRAYELISDINGKKLPSSATNRTKIFTNSTHIQSSLILNYRALRAYIKVCNEIIPSAILAYSKSSKNSWSDKASHKIDGALFFEKQNAKIITLELYNKLANKNYLSLKDLQNTSFIQDLNVKSTLCNIDAVDLSPVFVVQNLPKEELIEFYLETEIFEDKDMSSVYF
jgi:predicted adenine nucleotide alpha hydrolase (AANH) superfamily ATPase